MNILIVDNGTSYLSELRSLFNAHTIVVKEWDRLDIRVSDLDLIVLSGSKEHAVIYSQSMYQKQVDIIKNKNIPILGICAGFELIVETFGGKLTRLDNKVVGIRKIEIIKHDSIFQNIKTLEVYEGHRWTATEIPESLIVLAKSIDGYEIVKHTKKKIYGLQFHPEVQVGHNMGKVLVKNILDDYS